MTLVFVCTQAAGRRPASTERHLVMEEDREKIATCTKRFDNLANLFSQELRCVRCHGAHARMQCIRIFSERNGPSASKSSHTGIWFPRHVQMAAVVPWLCGTDTTLAKDHTLVLYLKYYERNMAMQNRSPRVSCPRSERPGVACNGSTIATFKIERLPGFVVCPFQPLSNVFGRSSDDWTRSRVRTTLTITQSIVNPYPSLTHNLHCYLNPSTLVFPRPLDTREMGPHASLEKFEVLLFMGWLAWAQAPATRGNSERCFTSVGIIHQ